MIERRTELLSHLEAAHDSYYRASVFTGPTLHFHLTALGAKNDFDRFTELCYAVLVSWGMHRLGPSGPKMHDFEQFKKSLESVWTPARSLEGVKPKDLTEDHWKIIELIFRNIRCMRTGPLLVGNSKVMAHLLPDLVPPIDRWYTLRFLWGHSNVPAGADAQWQKMKIALKEFFHPIWCETSFQSQAREWLLKRADYRWDTSEMKIIDNLIIGFSKMMEEKQPVPKTSDEVLVCD